MPHSFRTWLFTRASRTFKIIVATISAGAATVSILSFAQSHGLIDQPPAAHAPGQPSAEVAWIGVSPVVDTATAIGDTLHLTANVADARGVTVVGTSIAWSSDSNDIATVSPDGAVIARSPGTATIFAAAGAKIARARITVRQRVVGARIVSDSGLRVSVGQRRRLRGEGIDSRGNVVERRPVVWSISDTSVARIDSEGDVKGLAPGHTGVTAMIENVSVRGELSVIDIPASIAAVTSAAQTAPAGRPLTRPIEVEVLSSSGRPVADVTVRFGADSGDGVAEPASVQTDANGHARARWTLGETPGRQRLPITVEGVATPVLVYAEAEPVAANLRTVALSDTARGRAGEEVSGDVGLRLTDTLGRALPGVPVSWTATDGGSAVGAEPRTDSLGESRVRWTLGPKAGRQRATASIGTARTVPRVSIYAVAGPGAPANTLVIGGAGQSGTVGTTLARPLTLRVTDRTGNPVPNVTVSLLPAHGSVADSALVTDSTGTVRASWTLGRSTGPQRLIARVPGVSTPLALGARARALGAANVAFPDSAFAGETGRPISVTATVTDAYGNPVSDALVVFRAERGAVSSSRVMTDAEGHAVTSWRLGSAAGEQRLTASTKGVETKALLTVLATEPPEPTYAATSPKPAASKVAASKVAASKPSSKAAPKAASKTSSKTPSKPTAKTASSKSTTQTSAKSGKATTTKPSSSSDSKTDRRKTGRRFPPPPARDPARRRLFAPAHERAYHGA